MILLYTCVVICNSFFNIPANITNIAVWNNQKNFMTSFISPFLWLEAVCNYCYEEWQISYVQDASLYTTFLLFTRKSGLNYTVVHTDNPKSLIEGGFNTSTFTKIVIHGWLDDGTNNFAKDVREAYLSVENVNVIAVSWPGMSVTLYPLSVKAITPVGSYLAQFIDFLVMKIGLHPDSIHLIGHSLGAHVAGVVGEHVTFGNLSRITGLDPAEVLINSSSLDGRLDSSDATFVDVIHTTGGYLGIFQPCGHIDFYPNGGTFRQPGCVIDIGFCSHRRSYKYFSESISSLGFVSTACPSWSEYNAGFCKNNLTAVMGEHVDHRTKGTFYLNTNSKSPFAKWNDSFTTRVLHSLFSSDKINL